ncbi:xylulokinase [Rhodospirillaceae bacterium KN72]|uniref:Xylulose kinase n=1 Tax=Pacificispira spongiicola TaxID=2729598 RepID=A0A7Y0E1L1_9PROT|nr:xylulokinase [Pacificispira spongiicola]NMM45468.1 xylulokinase [Pacificispira spongiicola]
MYLGIDLGTSGAKILLMDEDQSVVATRTADLTVSRPAPGYAEQNPDDWVQAIGTAIDGLAASHPREMAALRGIGLSGQMHGAVLLDAGDRVLRPCILWNDTRSHAEAAGLDGDPAFRRITGNIVFPGFTAPKLVWLRENEPDIFDRVAKVLLPKDYLRLWLTGRHVSEMSDASGTSWLDVGGRRWSGELLGACNLDSNAMPDLVEGTDASGDLRASLAARWGVAGPVTVAGGAGDNAASAIGAGTVTPGSAFVSLGTSGVLFAATDRFLPAPDSAVHAFCHAIPDTWHQMGVILSATAGLSWFAGLLGTTPQALTASLGDRVQSPGDVIFLPYLSGERTPHNDAFIRGGFTGIGHTSDRDAMTRAILEGVAFALRDNLEALRQAGMNLHSVTAVGGGVRAGYWLRVMANALGIPVLLPADGDGGAAYGAARLGMIAVSGGDPTTLCTPPRIVAEFEPDPALSPDFEAAYQRFKDHYPALSRLARREGSSS